MVTFSSPSSGQSPDTPLPSPASDQLFSNTNINNSSATHLVGPPIVGASVPNSKSTTTPNVQQFSTDNALASAKRLKIEKFDT